MDDLDAPPTITLPSIEEIAQAFAEKALTRTVAVSWAITRHRAGVLAYRTSQR